MTLASRARFPSARPHTQSLTRRSRAQAAQKSRQDSRAVEGGVPYAGRLPLTHASALLLRCAAPASVALAALLCTSPAAAQAAASTAPTSASVRPILVLASPQVAGTDVDDRAIAVVTAHLRALDIDVRVVRPEAAAGDLEDGTRNAGSFVPAIAPLRKLIAAASARGALWLDAAHEEDFGLYALERDGDELYGRRVIAARGKTATALESLAGIAAAVGE